MRKTGNVRTLPHVLAFSTLLGMSGGCIAIYSFDDFDTKAPKTCTSVAECKTDSPACGTPTCDEICKITNLVSAETLSRNHVLGDCQKRFCDGKGNEVVELDPTNVRSDGNACTVDECDNITPVNTPAAADTPCGIPGTEGVVKCDATGVCRGCTSNFQCGVNTACAEWSCEGGTCVKKLQPVGTEVENPSVGDCRKKLCNSIGESEDTFAVNDAPDDNNPCTLDYCTTEYEIKHDIVAGTKCGDCKVCDAAGTCSDCDGTTSDCYQGECVPKPQTCTPNDNKCASTYCVDGYCCNSECGGKCMACSNALTGVLSGTCAPIINGTDPEGECTTLPGDSCFDGDCGCSNGVQDNGEQGIDCGPVCNNICSGKWSCGTQQICVSDNATQACCPAFVGCTTENCPNQTTECIALHNVGCTLGEPPKKFVVGSVVDGACWYVGFGACRTVTCTCK